MREISLEDKKIFEEFLSFRKHYLSCYHFDNIFIWQALYKVKWTVVESNLCVFFQDNLGCFTYLAPLGNKINYKAVEKCFEIMDRMNNNNSVTRIENVEEEDVDFFCNMGFVVKEKYPEYIYLREDLVNLKGKKFKTKRRDINYFLKNYRFEVVPFSLEYKDNCLRLYNYWRENRKSRYQDVIYQELLDDSFRVLQSVFYYYKKLDFKGWIVKIKDKVCGFTLGYPLNKDIFCILYEIADLKIKGLSQFIFWFFCNNLSEYKFINVMDDSGLKNLQQVKLSYYPNKLVSSYIVKRNE